MLRFTTAGESHGRAVAAVIEGLPAGLAFDEAYVNRELKRRQGGYGRGGRMAIEADAVEVLAGLKGGKTLGSPLVLTIPNRDYRIEKLPPVTKVRPGHVDLAGCLKYDTKDARDVLERASARETAARVLVGATCALLLREFGIRAVGHTLALAGIAPPAPDWSAVYPARDLNAMLARRDASPCYTLDNSRDAEMTARIDEAKAAGDTLGGMLEVAALGLPPGLGNHTQWDRKLDGRIAQACMSVQAMKAVEIGMGREVAALPGSAVHDPVELTAGGKRDKSAARRNPNDPTHYTRPTNNAGGLEAGITNGAPLVVRAAMKPIATLMRPLKTVDVKTHTVEDAAKERSDTCAVPAAGVVLENVVAVPLAEAFLEKFGGDSIGETRRNFEGYLKQLADFCR